VAGNDRTEAEPDLAYNGMRASGLRPAARLKSRHSNTSGNCVAMAGPPAGSLAGPQLPDSVAARYDKRELTDQGTLDVASIRIWLRDPVP
jgi:hypothetical protein